MALTPGTRLGPCEIVAPIGQAIVKSITQAHDGTFTHTPPPRWRLRVSATACRTNERMMII